ncbi:hypothetical protein CHUAL_010542 [Chamberlinius hualienensis]
MSRYLEEEIVDGGVGGVGVGVGVGEPGGGSTSSSDQVHYLHNGTVRRKLIVLKPESTFTSDPDRRNHLSHHHHHHHSDVIGGFSSSEKRMIYSPSDHGSHHTRMSLFDRRLMTSGSNWFNLKNCTRKLCLCFVVSVISVVFGAAIGVYFGFRILDAESTIVKEFRGAFRVVSGDNYTLDLMDTFSGAFLSRSQLYRAKLDTMFVSSVLKKAYLGSEILAIDPGDSETGDDIIVRFNIRMDSSKIDVDAGDIYLILINEVLKGQSRLLSGIKVDEDSIEVHERKSKLFKEKEPATLSTITFKHYRSDNKDKLITMSKEDEEELMLVTTETIFALNENPDNKVKASQLSNENSDLISLPTKTTSIAYDYGSKLLEAILSGNPNDGQAIASKNSNENNAQDTLADDGANRKHAESFISNEDKSFVATMPKMGVSERTETSESDKREVAIVSRESFADQQTPAQFSSVNVVVHQHDNFPKPKSQVIRRKPGARGWLLNDEPNTVVTFPPRTTRTTPVTLVSLPPRILSITELRDKSQLRQSMSNNQQPRRNKIRLPVNNDSQRIKYQTRLSGGWRTATTSTSTMKSYTVEYNRLKFKPQLPQNSNNSTKQTPIAIASTTTSPSTETYEKPIISNKHAPNSEIIASTLLPFLHLLSPDRKCVPPELDLCNKIDRNLTAIPSISSVLSMGGHDAKPAFDFIRSIIESGCFEYAHYFVCQLLQPGCHNGKPVLPCRSFCENFLEKCQYLLPSDLYRSLSCNILPEVGQAQCINTPECIHDLRSRGRNYLVCDGVVDCHDMSDETRCGWCSPGQFLCGGRKCVDKRFRCDGKPDCPNEADERNCLALANNGAEAKHAHPYLSEGFVFLNDKGSMGKICADALIKSLTTVTTKDDVDEVGPYFHILNPLSWRVTFLEAPCKSKQVIHVGCSDFECGRRPSRTPEHMVHFLDSTKHVALSDHGDWPWHAALFAGEHHVCDGTLIDAQWLLTSASCFQGLNGQQWTAKIGLIRMESTAPFQQHRKLVGRIHSPVKGSDIALVKLDVAIDLTDFVRPACLPTSDNRFPTGKRCVTLGWDLPRNQLRQVVVVITETEECLWRWPVGKLHVFCTAEPVGLLNDCQGEDQSGGPLLCEDNGSWYLAGVVNWRIGCGLSKQPRLYDSVSVNANWILTTIKKRFSALNTDIVHITIKTTIKSPQIYTIVQP